MRIQIIYRYLEISETYLNLKPWGSIGSTVVAIAAATHIVAVVSSSTRSPTNAARSNFGPSSVGPHRVIAASLCRHGCEDPHR